LELFQLLNDILIDYYLKTDKSKLVQTNIDSYKLPFKVKSKLLVSCIFGVDKDFNAVEASKFGLLLKLLENEETSSFDNIKPILPDLSKNIFFGNSLISPGEISSKDEKAVNAFDFSGLLFDVIVGNPPYMKSEDMKNITPLELPVYKNNYNSAYKQFDKYFLFLERGFNLLNEGGILGYIVPSKFTKVGAGKKLRELISKTEALNSIVSFGANQIFADKTTYTCLLILSKIPHNTFKYSEVKSLKSWLVREAEAFKSDIKPTKDLNSDTWVLIPEEIIAPYQNIISQSIKLEDLVGKENIFNGIQTSANDTYIFSPIREDSKFYYFEKKKVEFKIEKEITKPYFQTTSGEDNLYSYRTFKPNSRVIYPYSPTKKGVDLIPLNIIQAKYPDAYSYLNKHKSILANPKRDIKPTPKTENEWYRYGRHQSLDSCGLPSKIIVGVLSQGDKYAIDTNGTLISSGGTAGYCVVALPTTSAYSSYYIQAVLNSKYLEWFCAIYGEVFRGGYIARGTKVLKNLPIRKIDFTNPTEKLLHDKIAETQRELISIFDQIDQNPNNNRVLLPLKAQFKREKERLKNLLATLYNLGKDDLLIPLIKEIYEAD
jgi:Eco57I restriction-modification methylase/TaqI-like C-terminal specificity domain